MKPRPLTPSAGRAQVPGPTVTVRARSHDALMTATAKTVAALQEDNHSEPVLVVYGEDNAATLFCEQGAHPPKAGLQR